MATKADLIVFGTGSFAARIVFDLAATAERPTTVVIAGRNADRLNWLRVAANARAVIYERPARFLARMVDLSAADAAAGVIGEFRPSVVVQAASIQTSAVISSRGDGWTRLAAEGGLSATAVFQALLSSRVARTLKATRPECHFINCCYPDVVNPLITALGLPVTCGVGNVAILASVFAGELGARKAGVVKVLAHYQALGPWRRPAETRTGPAPRVWIDEREIADVYGTFAAVKLTPEPVIDISGASGVPLMLALAHGEPWTGHVPGPHGLPGGYPAVLRNGRLDLDLPASLGREEAVRWNARFEDENGLAVGADGKARYTGVLFEKLREVSPDLAEGFDVADLENVCRDMQTLRTRLQTQRTS